MPGEFVRARVDDDTMDTALKLGFVCEPRTDVRPCKKECITAQCHISMVASHGLFPGRYLQVQNKTTNTKWIVGKEKQEVTMKMDRNGTLAWWSAVRTDGLGSVHPSKRTLRKCESQR